MNLSDPLTLIALVVGAFALLSYLWPDRKPQAFAPATAEPGSHGVTLIRAYRAAGERGAGRIIEERLGAYEADQVITGLVAGVQQANPTNGSTP